MKKFGLLFVLLLALALAACGGNPAADTTGGAAAPTVAPTVTPAETPEGQDPLLAASVGNSGYDNCLDPWDLGRVREAYKSKISPTGYAGTVVLLTWTREAGPQNFDECYTNRHGQFVFTKHDVPITEELYERLTGGRNDLTVLAPVHATQVPSGWEASMWVHDYVNGFMTYEEVNSYTLWAFQNDAEGYQMVAGMVAAGLIGALLVPALLGGPMVPDCGMNSCG